MEQFSQYFILFLIIQLLQKKFKQILQRVLPENNLNFSPHEKQWVVNDCGIKSFSSFLLSFIILNSYNQFKSLEHIVSIYYFNHLNFYIFSIIYLK